MKKPTPNPPESDADTTSPCASVDSKKLHEAADRALDYYLNPAAGIMSSANEPEPMYLANPRYNTESLLANASETLGSASEMLINFAASLETSQRKSMRCEVYLSSKDRQRVRKVVRRTVFFHACGFTSHARSEYRGPL